MDGGNIALTVSIDQQEVDVPVTKRDISTHWRCKCTATNCISNDYCFSCRNAKAQSMMFSLYSPMDRGVNW